MTNSSGFNRVVVDHDVPVRMRDGVVLQANVYRPETGDRLPTLLTRTPYNKDEIRHAAWSGIDPVGTARAGFVVVVQDVRGRYASEGQWQPFASERCDGYDTIEWAADLPWSNGRVGMYSGSYCGNTQWLAALARPPALAAISPAFTWSEPTNGLLARGGAVELGLGLFWALEHGYDTVARDVTDSAELQLRAASLMDEWNRLPRDGYWELPVNEVPILRRHGVPALGGIRAIDNPEAADWSRIAGHYDDVAIPTFHTAGWYDIFIQGTLDNYMAMADRQRETRLVVGPWSHQALADPVGQQRFGPLSARDAAPIHAHTSWRDLHLAWLRRHLLPDQTVELPPAPVRIFVMGRNEWRDESEWPLRRARSQRWFLRSGGSLTQTAPLQREGPSSYTYNPMNPVPTIGGNGVPSGEYPAGPIDQAGVEARRDVLVFTSEPLRDDLEATGRVRVVLYAQSSAPSTDWVARLCDVHPDGRSLNLCDGILRVVSGAHDGQRYELDLWSTSNLFLRGHRVRVQVTSSSFPRWDRNLNTGDQNESSHQIARQRIYHDAERASHIELPVIA
jgi:putative CocE/NonD family hydrolase